MSHKQDCIFDITHSLPILGHSVSVSTRTPTADYTQKSKFMPDFGGVLEIPKEVIKNNALCRGIPFNPRSSSIELVETNREFKQAPNDCLIISSHLTSDGENQFTAIQAIGNTLYLDSVKLTNQPDENSTLIPYNQRSFDTDILGIKLTANADFLLVKFQKNCKTFGINKTYQIPQADTNNDILNVHSALKRPISLFENPDFYVKDSCLNTFSKNIQAVASDNLEQYQINFYDLNRTSRKPIQTVQWRSNVSNPNPVELDPPIDRTLRSRVIRKFLNKSPALKGIQQIDHIPAHLVNCLITTGHSTALIDPRINRLCQTYVHRSQIPSFYPIEFLRRTEFSKKNDYQFYSLANVHLRVFDTRYPGIPLNQINHMLDSDAYDFMNCKVIQHIDDNETICATTSDRVCFLTFDQSQLKPPINPKSNHLPFHETLCDHNDKIYGLDVRACKHAEEDLFSLYHLNSSQNLCVRNYKPTNDDCPYQPECGSRAKIIINKEREYGSYIPGENKISTSERKETDERDLSSPKDPIPNRNYINIMESPSDLEDKINSKRALERFEKMKQNFDTL